jgi:hypothetical protein
MPFMFGKKEEGNPNSRDLKNVAFTDTVALSFRAGLRNILWIVT